MNIKCIVACINANGEPDLCFVKVKCNQEDYNNGNHYEAAKIFAENEGYEGQGKSKEMIVFDENDSGGQAMINASLFVWKSASFVDIDGNEI